MKTNVNTQYIDNVMLEYINVDAPSRISFDERLSICNAVYAIKSVCDGAISPDRVGFRMCDVNYFNRFFRKYNNAEDMALRMSDYWILMAFIKLYTYKKQLLKFDIVYDSLCPATISHMFEEMKKGDALKYFRGCF